MVLADKKVDSFNDDKKWFNRINNVVDVPNLIQIQTASYDWLTGPGIKDLIDEISPIETHRDNQNRGGMYACNRSYVLDSLTTGNGAKSKLEHWQNSLHSLRGCIPLDWIH